MKRLFYIILTALVLMLISACSQEPTAAETGASTPEEQSKAATAATTLAEWEVNSIYEAGGLRAEYMIGEEVFGPKGAEIGSVEDAIVSKTGQIVALLIEVGGFWDISDTNIVVPWKKVKLTPDGFQVPVTPGTYEQYLLFGDHSFVTLRSLQMTHPVNEILATGAQTWLLSALLGDYVLLEGPVGYGYLDDVIFSKQGEITALIVQSSVPAYGYGTYAFPFNGDEYGWQPYDNVYKLHYQPSEIKGLQSFSYYRFNSYWH